MHIDQFNLDEGQTTSRLLPLSTCEFMLLRRDPNRLKECCRIDGFRLRGIYSILVSTRSVLGQSIS